MKKHHSLLLISALTFASVPALAVDPYAKPDDSWITISGTVASPTADSFLLDYGESVVLVEVDDWDSYGEAYPLLDGDKVTVSGRIDDDLYETTKIEAGSVYVESLNTYYYASSADEESNPAFFYSIEPVVVGSTTVRGTVTEVDPNARTFAVDTGSQRLEVNTEQMLYNPLDDAGFQQIDKGDRVSVTGSLSDAFFTGRELEADRVVTLWDNNN